MAERLHLLGTPAHTRAASDSAGTEPGDNRSDSAAAAPLPAERLYQLAVYLACHPSWQPREHLAALFWPELDSAAARRNLRKLLFRAGALLPTIETRADSVRWPVDTDLARFEAACREQRWAEAIELHCGPLAEGFERGAPEPYVEWLRFERNRVGALFRAAVVRRLEKLETPEARLPVALRWFAGEPLDEDAVIAVVDALLAQQRITEAHRTYRDFSHRLAAELGVEPSARARARMLCAESGATAAAGSAAPRSGDTPGTHGDTVRAAEAIADGFIGRARELQDLNALIQRPECRLLTVTGPGGVGKSRLVKQALRDIGARFVDGAYWIALDDLATSTQAVARIASELSVGTSAGQDVLERVCEHLAARRVLLVLDNCEHIASLVQLVTRLSSAASGLRICATSRVRLCAPGEWLLPLQGLSLDTAAPGDRGVDDPLASDAARLFITAALVAKPAFDAAAHTNAIGELVRAVGGLPLAILLAAHWTRLLPVRHIADELAQSLDILESADEGEERPEHRSVRATFDQSWRMLAPAEQEALAAMSAFAGPFTRAAARTVAAAAIPLLASLADKSLLQVREDGRCSLHPLIRRFAADELAQSGQLSVVQRRHGEYFCALLESHSTYISSDERSRTASIASDLSDLLMAFSWARRNARFDLLQHAVFPLVHFYFVTGRAAEGLEVLGPMPPPPDTASRSQIRTFAHHADGLARLMYLLTRFDEAADAARMAFRYAKRAGDPEGVRVALSILATLASKLGRLDESRRYSEQTLRLSQQAGDRVGVATSLLNLGKVETDLGLWDSAIARFTEALHINRDCGNQLGVIAALSNLGGVCLDALRPLDALGPLSEGLELCESAGLSGLRVDFVVALSRAHAGAGRFDEARQLAEEGLACGRSAADAGNVLDSLIVLARSAIAAGDPSLAAHRLRDAVTAATATQHTRARVRCLRLHMRWLHANGQGEAAQRLAAWIAAFPASAAADIADANSIRSDCRTPSDRVERPVGATSIDAALAQLQRDSAAVLERAGELR